jgi:hypothetical protein
MPHIYRKGVVALPEKFSDTSTITFVSSDADDSLLYLFVRNDEGLTPYVTHISKDLQCLHTERLQGFLRTSELAPVTIAYSCCVDKIVYLFQLHNSDIITFAYDTYKQRKHYQLILIR